ncbi:MAG: cytochrome d ubiquinol oxidase subunit II [Acidimicrobiia bacterium]|nr:cytochrome d ubiquinol oxidase subunit II [Acidimicrobiia bacterium]
MYLARDAHAFGEEGLADYFRVRGLGAGIATGAIAVGGAIVLAFDDGSALVEDAPTIFEGLTGRALPLMILSAVGGLGALGLLWKQRYGPARLAAAGAVLVVIWGWAVGQYPYMLEGVITIEEAAGAESTLISTLVVAAIGLVVLAPSLAWLFVLMQRGTFMEQGDDPAWTAGRHLATGAPDRDQRPFPPGPPGGKAG